jgi:hypothetical protein
MYVCNIIIPFFSSDMTKLAAKSSKTSKKVKEKTASSPPPSPPLSVIVTNDVSKQATSQDVILISEPKSPETLSGATRVVCDKCGMNIKYT